MIRIPYGQADFESLRLGKKFYQDRTHFIAKLEEWPSQYPIFLRPRRFGKSLFVSILHHYYGLEHKDKFQMLFGDLYIGQNPTPLANTYMVLYFEFSGIDTKQPERTFTGFLAKVRAGVSSFLAEYGHFFTIEQKNYILSQESPETMMIVLFNICKNNHLPHKIYLIIDEYDHFTNELLSFDFSRFIEGVTRNGFVHKTYETFKTAAGNGVIDRIFITGVSPITLDSLTSGFNIGKNISTNPIFHDLMGFKEAEVENLLHLCDIPAEKIPSMMDDLRAWYDGYRFSEGATNHLYNTNMVLNFLLEYGIANKYPQKMLDENIAADYSKVAALFKIGGDEDARFKLLETLVTDGYIDFPLAQIFNLTKPTFSDQDFLSLLFYMGMLTIRESRSVGLRFEVPNYVIKKLYFEYFTSVILDKANLATTRKNIAPAVSALLDDGNPEPFFKIVEEVLKENHANRDEMSYGEKHLQTLMVGLLYPYESYMIHSEYETRRGYPDIFLERVPDKPMPYEIVLELKYATKSKADTLPAKIADAKSQLNTYMASTRFARPNVRGYYVAFLGGELYEWKEHGTY